MTLRFASGLGETHLPGTSDQQFLRHWRGGNNGLSGATGSGFLSNVVSVDSVASIDSPTFALQNTWIIQGMLRADGAMDSLSNSVGFQLRSGAADQLRVEVIPEPATAPHGFGVRYALAVKRGGTTLAQTAFDFYATEWNAIQFKATIDPAVGAYEVKVAKTEGTQVLAFVSVLSASGVNTADTGVAGADNLRLDYTATGTNVKWDHFFIMDDQGTVNNNFPSGLLLVHDVLPNKVGAQNDWTSQGGQGSGASDYESVNDPADNVDDDVGRHVSSVPGDIFLVGYQVPGTTGAIGAEAGHPIAPTANVAGVIFNHVSGMESSGTRTVRPIYRNVLDVRAEGADKLLNSTSFDQFTEVFELNPVSAAAWTGQEALDMQWGLKLQS